MEDYIKYLSKYNPLINTSESTSLDFDVPVYTPIDDDIPVVATPSKEEAQPQPEIQPQPEVKPEVQETNYNLSGDWDDKVGHMSNLIKLMNEEHIPFKVSSGFRKNALTNKGALSWHSKGYAIDIVPSAGSTWKDLKEKLYSNKRIQQWMKDNNMGAIDETGKDAHARFGATGANIHIGKDEYARNEFWRTVGKYQWGGSIPKSYTVKSGDTLDSISQLLNVSKDSLLKYSKIENPNKINTGDELYYYVKPTLGQNLSNFFFESPEDNAKKLMTTFTIEGNKTDKQNHPSVKIADRNKVIDEENNERAEDIALKFITGKGTKYNGWEDFKPNPYWDKVGQKWTVGFGYAQPDVHSYQNISKDKAYELTSKIINESIVPNLKKYKGFDKLDTNMKAALIDAAYGLGPTGFAKSKNLIGLMAEGAPKEEMIKEIDWNLNSNDGRATRTKARRLLANGTYNWNVAPYTKGYYEN